MIVVSCADVSCHVHNLCTLLSTLHVPAGKKVLRKQPMVKHVEGVLRYYVRSLATLSVPCSLPCFPMQARTCCKEPMSKHMESTWCWYL
jgi:hypothetical protein